MYRALTVMVHLPATPVTTFWHKTNSSQSFSWPQIRWALLRKALPSATFLRTTENLPHMERVYGLPDARNAAALLTSTARASSGALRKC